MVVNYALSTKVAIKILRNNPKKPRDWASGTYNLKSEDFQQLSALLTNICCSSTKQ